MVHLNTAAYFLMISTLVCFSPFTIKQGEAKEIPSILKPYVPSEENELKEGEVQPCCCGIFLSCQVTKKGGPATGNPLLQHCFDEPFQPIGNRGNKLCTQKCVEMITKHLPQSQEILCAVVEKDIEGEKAHLFVKNGEDKWINTNIASPQEYCCKNNSPYTCPGTPGSLITKKLSG